MRVLAREMSFDVLEWRNSADEWLEYEDFGELGYG